MIGGARKRVLTLAAREADVVSMNNVPWADPDPMGEAECRIGYVRAGAGERFAEIELESAASLVQVTDDPQSVLERVAPGLRNADPRLLARHPNVLVGSVAQIVERLEERREQLGINYVAVTGDNIDTFAPVVARLAGR
jgi:alkanesulfonate monooxygenase SsuD/methylene tetrahydromethanopterin reductase-like flavin-dependent oxidoreductase (luciferase family)